MLTKQIIHIHTNNLKISRNVQTRHFQTTLDFYIRDIKFNSTKYPGSSMWSLSANTETLQFVSPTIKLWLSLSFSDNPLNKVLNQN